MHADQFVERLQRVRGRGPGRWIASCPVSGNHPRGDRNPSLSIAEGNDRILVRCWSGGCSALDIANAAGLELADLFHDRRIRRNDLADAPRASATDVLCALDHESHVVVIIAHDMLEHREIDGETFTRLQLAASRIGSARAAIAPERVPR